MTALTLRRNVLIFHAGALGDFVLTWPLALALGRMWPQSRIIYVTQHGKGLLAEKALRVESTDIEAGWHHLFSDGKNLPNGPVKFLQSSHSIFAFLGKDGDTWMRSAGSVSNSANIYSVQSPGPGDEHAVQKMVNSLASLPAISAAVQQILSSINSQGIPRRASDMEQKILLHPGSGSDSKNWRLESFLELAGSLKSNGHAVEFLLGEVELEKWNESALAAMKKVAAVRNPKSYVELYDHFASARAFIGNDSGPGHLAGILGVPTLILFGPTDPAIWKPLGPRVYTLHHQPLNALAPSDVLKAIPRLFD